MFNKKFKINELYVAEIARVKSVDIENDRYVAKYDIIRTGIFKRIGEDKFFHIQSGMILEKLDSFSAPHEFYVATKNGMYLSFLIKNQKRNKISTKEIIKLEKEINQKIEKQNEENKNDEIKK